MLRIELVTERRQGVVASIATAPSRSGSATLPKPAAVKADEVSSKGKGKQSAVPVARKHGTAQGGSGTSVPALHAVQSGIAIEPNSTSQQVESVSFLRDAVPNVLSRKEWGSRLESVECWLQHLQVLERLESQKLLALALAFGDDARSTGTPRDEQSGAHATLREMLETLQAELELLLSAVPLSQRSAVVDELTDLWKDIDKKESNADAQKIRSLVLRRLQGKTLLQADRREEYNKTLWGIRRRIFDDSWDSEDDIDVSRSFSARIQNQSPISDAAFVQDDSNDEDYKPGSSDSSGSESDGSNEWEVETDQRQSASKGVNLEATQSSVVQTASFSTAAATTSAPAAVASSNSAGSDDTSDSDFEPDEERE